MKTVVLGVSTYKEDSINVLNWKKSLEQFNYDYEIVGKGEQWGGWKWRTQKYIESINKYNDDDLIILCDVSDVIFIQDRSKLEQKFKEKNLKVIFGSEENCCTGTINVFKKWYFLPKLKDIVFSKGRCLDEMNNNCKNNNLVFPNGGCLIGYKKYILDILMKNSDYDDDQYGYMELLLKDNKLFDIDYKRDFILNLSTFIFVVRPQNIHFKDRLDFSNEWNITDDLLKNNDNYPFIVHTGGKNFNAYNKIGNAFINDFIKVEEIYNNNELFTDPYALFLFLIYIISIIVITYTIIKS